MQPSDALNYVVYMQKRILTTSSQPYNSVVYQVTTNLHYSNTHKGLYKKMCSRYWNFLSTQNTPSVESIYVTEDIDYSRIIGLKVLSYLKPSRDLGK